MTNAPRQRRRVCHWALGLSALAWALLFLGSNSGTLAHCAATRSGASVDSFRMMLEMNPPGPLLAGWFVMIVAMMLPTHLDSIHHVLERSFKHRGWRAVALFFTGYSFVWMASGLVVLPMQLVCALVWPASYWPAVMVGLIAVVWQCSPGKQRCLNRGHHHRELRAFGAGADWDVLRFGLTHGVWCAGSCWALMLFPMLLPNGHFAAMALVSVQMVSERLEPPRPLDWRWRGPGKIYRILMGQMRLRWQGVLGSPAPASSPLTFVSPRGNRL